MLYPGLIYIFCSTTQTQLLYEPNFNFSLSVKWSSCFPGSFTWKITVLLLLLYAFFLSGNSTLSLLLSRWRRREDILDQEHHYSTLTTNDDASPATRRSHFPLLFLAVLSIAQARPRSVAITNSFTPSLLLSPAPATEATLA